jgi:hypothetical protein
VVGIRERVTGALVERALVERALVERALVERASAGRDRVSGIERPAVAGGPLVSDVEG